MAAGSFALKVAAAATLAADCMTTSWMRSNTGFALVCDTRQSAHENVAGGGGVQSSSEEMASRTIYVGVRHMNMGQ